MIGQLVQQFLLVVYIALVPGQPYAIYRIHGQSPLEECQAKGPQMAAAAQTKYPGAVVFFQCLPMATGVE